MVLEMSWMGNQILAGAQIKYVETRLERYIIRSHLIYHAGTSTTFGHQLSATSQHQIHFHGFSRRLRGNGMLITDNGDIPYSRQANRHVFGFLMSFSTGGKTLCNSY